MLRGYGVRGWWWHKTSQNSKAQVAIVDTPGALQSRLTDYMKAADVIVIPTRITSRDIEPLQRMQAAVKANAQKAKIIYVLNGWNRWRASSDFLDWFKGLGWQGHDSKTAAVRVFCSGFGLWTICGRVCKIRESCGYDKGAL